MRRAPTRPRSAKDHSAAQRPHPGSETRQGRSRHDGEGEGHFYHSVPCVPIAPSTPPYLAGSEAEQPSSTITVLLQPFKGTRFARTPTLEATETGALARFGNPSVALGSIQGEHPHAARINVGEACPPGTILAVSADLTSPDAQMNLVFHVVDVVHRTSLVIRSRVTCRSAERLRETAALEDCRRKVAELEARLEESHAKTAENRELAAMESRRVSELERTLQAVTAERDTLAQREDARRAEVEHLKENDRRRNAERQAEQAHEAAMARLREREAKDIAARQAEREAERRAEQERHAERESERRLLAQQLHKIESERQTFIRERATFEAICATFERERDVFDERERQWRSEMHRALSEVTLCRACASRRELEQNLQFTQEQLRRALEEKSLLNEELASMRALEAARRSAELRLGPIRSTLSHSVAAAVPLLPFAEADVQFEGVVLDGSIVVSLDIPVPTASEAERLREHLERIGGWVGFQRPSWGDRGAPNAGITTVAPRPDDGDGKLFSASEAVLGRLAFVGGDEFIDAKDERGLTALSPVSKFFRGAQRPHPCPLPVVLARESVVPHRTAEPDEEKIAAIRDEWITRLHSTTPRNTFVVVAGASELALAIRTVTHRVEGDRHFVEEQLEFAFLSGRRPDPSDISRLLGSVALNTRLCDSAQYAGGHRSTVCDAVSQLQWPFSEAHELPCRLALLLALRVQSDGLVKHMNRDHSAALYLTSPTMTLHPNCDALTLPLSTTAMLLVSGASQSRGPRIVYPFDTLRPLEHIGGSRRTRRFLKRLSIVLRGSALDSTDASVHNRYTTPSDLGGVVISSPDVRVEEGSGNILLKGVPVGRVLLGLVNGHQYGSIDASTDGFAHEMGQPADSPFPTVRVEAEFVETVPEILGTMGRIAAAAAGRLVEEIDDSAAILRAVGLSSVGSCPGRRLLHCSLTLREEVSEYLPDAFDRWNETLEPSSDDDDDEGPFMLGGTMQADLQIRDATVTVGAAIQVVLQTGVDVHANNATNDIPIPNCAVPQWCQQPFTAHLMPRATITGSMLRLPRARIEAVTVATETPVDGAFVIAPWSAVSAVELGLIAEASRVPSSAVGSASRLMVDLSYQRNGRGAAFLLIYDGLIIGAASLGSRPTQLALEVELAGDGTVTADAIEGILRSIAYRTDRALAAPLSIDVRLEIDGRRVLDERVRLNPVPPPLCFPSAALKEPSVIVHREGAGPEPIFTTVEANDKSNARAALPLELCDSSFTPLLESGGAVVLVRIARPDDDALGGASVKLTSVAAIRSSSSRRYSNAADATFQLNVLRCIERPSVAGAAIRSAASSSAGSFTIKALSHERLRSLHAEAHDRDIECFAVSTGGDGDLVAHVLVSSTAVEWHLPPRQRLRAPRRLSFAGRPPPSPAASGIIGVAAVTRGTQGSSNTPVVAPPGYLEDVATLLCALRFWCCRTPERDHTSVPLRVAVTELESPYQYNTVVSVSVEAARLTTSLEFDRTDLSLLIPGTPAVPCAIAPLVPSTTRVRRAPIDFGCGPVSVTVAELRDQEESSKRPRPRVVLAPAAAVMTNWMCVSVSGTAVDGSDDSPAAACTLLKRVEGDHVFRHREGSGRHNKTRGPVPHVFTAAEESDASGDPEHALSNGPQAHRLFLNARAVGNCTWHDETPTADDSGGGNQTEQANAVAAAELEEPKRSLIFDATLQDVACQDVESFLAQLTCTVAVSETATRTAPERYSMLIKVRFASAGSPPWLELEALRTFVVAPNPVVGMLGIMPATSDVVEDVFTVGNALGWSLGALTPAIGAAHGERLRPLADLALDLPDKHTLQPGSILLCGLDAPLPPLRKTSTTTAVAKSQSDAVAAFSSARSLSTHPSSSDAARSPPPIGDTLRLEFPPARHGYSMQPMASNTSLGTTHVLLSGSKQIAEVRVAASHITLVVPPRSATPVVMSMKQLKDVLRHLVVVRSSAAVGGGGDESTSPPRHQRVHLLWADAETSSLTHCCRDLMFVPANENAGSPVLLYSGLIGDNPLLHPIGERPLWIAAAAVVALAAGDAAAAAQGSSTVDGRMPPVPPTTAVLVRRVSLLFTGTAVTNNSENDYAQRASRFAAAVDGPTLPWSTECLGFDLYRLGERLGLRKAVDASTSGAAVEQGDVLTWDGEPIGQIAFIDPRRGFVVDLQCDAPSSLVWAQTVLRCVTYSVAEEPAQLRRHLGHGGVALPKVPLRKFLLAVTISLGTDAHSSVSTASCTLAVQPLRCATTSVHEFEPVPGSLGGRVPLRTVLVDAAAILAGDAIPLFPTFSLLAPTGGDAVLGGPPAISGAVAVLEFCDPQTGVVLHPSQSSHLAAIVIDNIRDAGLDAVVLTGLLPSTTTTAPAMWMLSHAVDRGITAVCHGYESPLPTTRLGTSPAVMSLTVDGSPAGMLLFSPAGMEIQFPLATLIAVIDRVVRALSVVVVAAGEPRTPTTKQHRDAWKRRDVDDGRTSRPSDDPDLDMPHVLCVQLTVRTTHGQCWSRAVAIRRLADGD